MSFCLRSVRVSSPFSSAISPMCGRVLGPSNKSWKKEHYFQQKEADWCSKVCFLKCYYSSGSKLPDSSWFHSMDDHMQVLIPVVWPCLTFQRRCSLRSALKIKWVYFQNWYFCTGVATLLLVYLLWSLHRGLSQPCFQCNQWSLKDSASRWGESTSVSCLSCNTECIALRMETG